MTRQIGMKILGFCLNFDDNAIFYGVPRRFNRSQRQAKRKTGTFLKRNLIFLCKILNSLQNLNLYKKF